MDFVKINLLEVGNIAEIARVYRDRPKQWGTIVVGILLENDAFPYLTSFSILFASSVNSLISCTQFNDV